MTIIACKSGDIFILESRVTMLRDGRCDGWVTVHAGSLDDCVRLKETARNIWIEERKKEPNGAWNNERAELRIMKIISTMVEIEPAEVV